MNYLMSSFVNSFRFNKNDISKLVVALKFPETFKLTDSGNCASGEEVLLIVLARLAFRADFAKYPCLEKKNQF